MNLDSIRDPAPGLGQPLPTTSAADEWLNLGTYLRDLGPQPVVFVPNPGNGGDSLIAMAILQLFVRCEIRFEIWRPGDSTTGKTVLYSGGGNLVPLYSDCANFLAAHHADAKRIIVLPHTIDGHSDLLRELGPNVELLCRERKSFDYVRGVARGARVRLAEDVALSLDVESILSLGAPDITGVRREKRLRRSSRRLHRQLLTRRTLASLSSLPGGERTLRCFRRDLEQSSQPLPFGNIDLSDAVPCDSRMTCPRSVARSSWEILNFLRNFDAVHTNRLHLCIAAALLGKRVYFYENVYWKNREVFEASIAKRFKRVTWCSA